MIRKAAREDIIDINLIGNQYKSNFQSTYNVEEYLLNENYIILVNEDNKVNAFLIVYKNIDFFELEMIVVDKNFHKQGIATNLISYLLSNFVKENGSILLEVASNNTKALNLYKKFGFELLNIRKKYYDSKIDAYVMKKVI